MPNRIVREGLIDSERVNQLSANAERFYIRLMLKADDFGRFSGNTLLLKAGLFPLKPDVRDADIPRWIAECEKAGLVRSYEVTGKHYLEVLNFQQRTRAEKSRYPAPPMFHGEHAGFSPPTDGQPPVNGQTAAHVVGGVVVVGGGDGPRKRGAHALPDDFQITPELRTWCDQHGYDQPQASLDYMRDWAKSGDKRKADWEATLRNCIKGDWGDARKKARERILSNPNAPRQVVRCTVEGCQGEAGSIWGGKCAVHWAQSKPSRVAA